MSDCKIINNDAISALAKMSAQSVHCVVTSPPYWRLRDYGTEGQIGLESTLDGYVAKIVEVFSGVRRVLRNDGTLWVNMGDVYVIGRGVDKTGNPRSPGVMTCHNAGEYLHSANKIAATPMRSRSVGSGLKPKDLCGIPWRIAFALQADGWYLRSDIIWAKPNPMPESITDRPTKSHEYMFLLTKQPRYFFDSYAVREKGIIPAGTLAAKGSEERFAMPGVSSRPPEYKEYDGMRNIRSVWNIATSPFPGAHFATFPPKLIEPCIKAGTSERGCCPKCLVPWRRVVEREGMSIEETGVESQGRRTGGTPARDTDRRKYLSGSKQAAHKAQNPDVFVGWELACKHDDLESIPCTVLDPFFGSGTTGLVALGMNRSCIGIELNSEYAKMAYDRVNSEHTLFSNVELVNV